MSSTRISADRLTNPLKRTGDVHHAACSVTNGTDLEGRSGIQRISRLFSETRDEDWTLYYANRFLGETND
jgi:hypothetical protein